LLRENKKRLRTSIKIKLKKKEKKMKRKKEKKKIEKNEVFTFFKRGQFTFHIEVVILQSTLMKEAGMMSMG
jgi:hypothetical protein